MQRPQVAVVAGGVSIRTAVLAVAKMGCKGSCQPKHTGMEGQGELKRPVAREACQETAVLAFKVFPIVAGAATTKVVAAAGAILVAVVAETMPAVVAGQALLGD